MPRITHNAGTTRKRGRKTTGKSRQAATHEISNGKRIMAVIELYANDEIDFSLGVFSDDRPPKGFMIEFESDADSEQVTSTMTTSQVSRSSYGVELHLVNASNEPVIAQVWELS